MNDHKQMQCWYLYYVFIYTLIAYKTHFYNNNNYEQLKFEYHESYD